MNSKKCPLCGAEMEISFSEKSLVCPYCGEHIKANIKDTGKTAFLDGKMFDFLWEPKSLQKYDNVKECIDSMRYCLNELRDTDSIIRYIRSSLINDSDVASEGVNQERLDKILPLIDSHIEPGEQVILYGDNGIIIRGKWFFVITDRKSIFVNGKKTSTLLHSELNSLRLNPCDGYPRWSLNNKDELVVTSVGNKFKLQGAVMAVICILARKQSPHNDKIKLM